MTKPEQNLELVEAGNMPAPAAQNMIANAVVTPQQALEAYETLREITKKALTKGVDYDEIPGTNKPSLLKAGAENLLRFYGLGHRVEKTESVMDWDRGLFYFEYKVTVYRRLEDGSEFVLSECYGSANSKEPKFHKKRNGDLRNPFELVNTLQKMAIKRALVGAALQATGASGLFTQDVEDMEIEVQAGPEKQVPKKKATTKQVNYIYKLAKDKGIDEELLGKVLAKAFGVSKPEDLGPNDASTAIKLLQSRTQEQFRKYVESQDQEDTTGQNAETSQEDEVLDLFEGGEVIDIPENELPFD